MRGRFAVVTIGLASTGAFLVGLVVAGSMAPSFVHSDVPPAQTQPRIGAPPPDRETAGLVNFADVVERINLAVVNIDATAAGPSGARRRLDGDRRDRGFFDDTPRFGPQTDTTRPWAGSGFVIDPDGHILTNHHVVEQADRISVKFADGSSYRAHVVGSDPDTDIALIKVDGPGRLPFAPLGDSDTLRVGEWVSAIGNPLAYEHTVTVGVVSYIGRKLYDRSLDNYIQTDAAINFGNSGGPLINARGEVVGISAAISQRASNIGFAIPINQAIAILPQLREHGRVSRGFLGVGLTDVTPDLRRSLDLDTTFGAIVQDVTAGSPGDRAGLRTYDLIVAVDGRDVLNNDELIQDISSRRPGSTARLEIVRDRRPIELAVRLGERPSRSAGPDAAAPVGARPPANASNALGLMVREIDAPLPRATTGVLVTRVDAIGPAAEAGIERGHVLMEINRRVVGSMADFARVTNGVEPGDVLMLYVYVPELDQRSLRTVRIDPK